MFVPHLIPGASFTKGAPLGTGALGLRSTGLGCEGQAGRSALFKELSRHGVGTHLWHRRGYCKGCSHDKDEESEAVHV